MHHKKRIRRKRRSVIKRCVLSEIILFHSLALPVYFYEMIFNDRARAYGKQREEKKEKEKSEWRSTNL